MNEFFIEIMLTIYTLQIKMIPNICVLDLFWNNQKYYLSLELKITLKVIRFEPLPKAISKDSKNWKYTQNRNKKKKTLKASNLRNQDGNYNSILVIKKFYDCNLNTVLTLLWACSACFPWNFHEKQDIREYLRIWRQSFMIWLAEVCKI